MIKNVGTALILVTSLFMASISSAQDVVAVVTGKLVRIRKDPNVESVAFAAIAQGEKVVVIESGPGEFNKGAWVKVRSKKCSAGYGYMSTRYLALDAEKKIGMADGSTQINGVPARMVFSLAKPEILPGEETAKVEGAPVGNPMPVVGTKSVEVVGSKDVKKDMLAHKVVEIVDKYNVETRIKNDIDKLTESLAKEGKEPDIRSVVVMYSPKSSDEEKNKLRAMIDVLKVVVVGREQEVDRQAREITRLKEVLDDKERSLVAQGKLDGEVAALRNELKHKGSGTLNSGNEKDIAVVKNMVASIQQQIIDMMKPLSEKKTGPQVDPEEVANLRKAVAVLTRMPDFKLVSLVETQGESAFLKGVGNVKMFTEGDLTVFRVPTPSSEKGEKVFAHMIKRIVNGDEAVYFICNKNMVQGSGNQSGENG